MGRVVVVGQGYVGLPVAVRAVEVGYDVVGFDLDEGRVKGLADGVSFVEDITDERLARAYELALPIIITPTRKIQEEEKDHEITASARRDLRSRFQ